MADNENNESLQSPPDVDGLLVRLPHQPRSPIKIIWPNGEVRQIIGEFTLSNLLALQGGKLKFAFPRQTIQLTRDWILRIVNNRWRAYKSKLKKQCFNRDERTLEEILREKALTTNEHQWRSLVGIWCQEQHKKLFSTNSRCAKEQKTAHTCGRKSLARLKKRWKQELNERFIG